ncbi:MAG TPA: ATP-binding protein [Longimicrobiaceae bacterium]
MDQERLRILIVDDDEVDRTAVRRALRAAGIDAEVSEAEDVAGALEALRGTELDCVLLDFQLPGGDGTRVLREARAAGLQAPIVMLTGHEDTQTAVELMKQGASDYLSKGSLSPERLGRSVRAAVRVSRAEARAREAGEALRESEARFRVLHETSPDGFVILRSRRGADGVVADFEYLYANRAAERILGHTAAALVGRGMLELFPAVRGDGLFGAYLRVVETGDPFQTEVHYGRDGLDLWFRITAVRLHDGFALGFSDVSRQKRAEAERERALSSRSRFYAAMSHELRTPINAILGYNDLLLAEVYGPLNAAQEGGLERSQRAARHLLELVNDVLDLSKLEAGKTEVQVEEVDVPELIEELFSTVGPLAEERGSRLEMHCAAPPRIRTDPRRVRQILLNLLSNAIKFGEGHPIEVRCGDGAGGGVTVEVTDRGSGISADDLPRIFDEFVQLPSANTGGTGLGLPISRRLTLLLGGTLEAESAPGAGSTFRLFLPPELEVEEEHSTPGAEGAALV